MNFRTELESTGQNLEIWNKSSKNGWAHTRNRGFECMDSERQAGIVGWSKTMIEKQRVPGSSPPWKRKDFFQPFCDPQLIGNSWPGTRKTWMQ